MKSKTPQGTAAASAIGGIAASHGSNGNSIAVAEPASADLSVVLAALQTMRDGDFSVRLPGSWTGLAGKIADTFNDIVAANQQMSNELKRVGQVVGKEGRTRERTKFHESRGAWGQMEVSVNTLVDDLLRPTTEVTRAIGAVAQGNLTQTVRLDVDGRPLEGEFLRSADIVNTMIQQLGVFTSEVTRVAREVGTDGKFGGQAHVPGVAGIWKDLDRIGQLDGQQPDGQVRNIAEVATAVASGDLVAQNHSRCPRRNSAAERSHQHHGRPAAFVCVGSNARGPRSRHRRQARRTSCCARRGRDLERSYRFGQRNGRQPYRAGPQHR